MDDFYIGIKVLQYTSTSETQSALTSTVASEPMLAS